MNRRLLAPLALLNAGCLRTLEVRPTPSLEAAERPPTFELQKQVELPRAEQVMARWQLPAANPWAPFTKLTLLASLPNVAGTRILPALERAPAVARAQRAAQRLAERGLALDTLWLVDVRGPEAVAFGAALSEASTLPISTVVTFNNWPFLRELIPSEETLAALAQLSPRAPPAGVRTVPVFLLDAWRLAYPDITPDPEVVDNRYSLGAGDLPEAALLEAEGIRRVTYVVDQRAPGMVEEEDLNERFLEYEEAGIQVFLVDLDELSGDGLPTSTGSTWVTRVFDTIPYHPEPRRTLLQDPDFYRRCHSSFGGLLAGRVATAHGAAAFTAAHASHGGG